MKTHLLLLIACALIGCHSASPQAGWTPPRFDAPRDGQIQVALFGEVKSPGLNWMSASSTLASVEAVAVLGTPRNAMLTRVEHGRAHNTVFVIAKMSQSEKEAVSLKHGDMLQFYTGQPPQSPQ